MFFFLNRKKPQDCVRNNPSVHLSQTNLVVLMQYVATISSRQMDMQKFIADGCKEALLEEKRRFCFLADKHCMFSYHISNFHEKVRKMENHFSPSVVGFLKNTLCVFVLGKAKETLSLKLPTWQEKCCDISKVPETVKNMIEGLSSSPEATPLVGRLNGVSGRVAATLSKVTLRCLKIHI